MWKLINKNLVIIFAYYIVRTMRNGHPAEVSNICVPHQDHFVTKASEGVYKLLKPIKLLAKRQKFEPKLP